MAKLTRKQVQALESVLYHAKRARAYLEKPDIAVGVLNRPATTTLHYARADGSTFYAENKDIGSDLCGLEFAIKGLDAFLRVAAGLKGEES